MDSWDSWREARRRSLAALGGPLTLVATEWLPDGAVPDLDAVRTEVAATATVTELSRPNADTGSPEHGYRVWDADAPAVHAFAGIETFPHDPAWVLPATFSPVDAERTIPYEHLRDAVGTTRGLPVPGDIAVTIGGDAYTLAGFADGDALVVVFADPTNRADDPDLRTYPTGRFVRVRLDGAGPQEITLDLNRAYIPPCGFSDSFNCPLPPASNRIRVPVTAGERSVIRR
jgi:uncharacterized protein (DUF1684 family)